MIPRLPAFLALATFPALPSCGAEEANPRDIVAAMMEDPDSARFQSVRERTDHVCGEVNARVPSGGYTGYRRFVVDRRTGTAMIEPREEIVASAASHLDPACSKPAGYQSVDERFACAQAPVERQASDQQRRFEIVYANSCKR